MYYRQIIRSSLILLLASGVVFLLWQAIVPAGQITYATDFSSDNFFIRKFTPAERVVVTDGQVRINGNPVYFNLRTQRTFDQAEIKMRYQNNSDSIIEIGPLVDMDLWRYRLQPVENPVLEQIGLVWPSVQENGVTLWQRPGLATSSQYASVGKLLADPPDLNEIAVYNYDPGLDFVLADYEPDAESMNWGYSLRGDWQAFVYIGNGELQVEIQVNDLNQNSDPDPAELRLYYKDVLLATEVLADDGNHNDNGIVSEARTFTIRQNGLPAGAYKLEFRANRDLVSTAIASTQSKFVFNSRLEFHLGNNSDINMWTDSDRVQVLTTYPESLQTVNLGENNLMIKETYAQFEGMVVKASSSERTALVRLETDGVQVAGEGTFAVSKSAWFNPKLKKVSAQLDFNGAGINYVLADYSPPLKQAEWQSATLAIDLKDSYREDGQYSLLLSAPGLTDGDQNIIIDSLAVRLTGKTLWEKISQIFNEKNN